MYTTKSVLYFWFFLLHGFSVAGDIISYILEDSPYLETLIVAGSRSSGNKCLILSNTLRPRRRLTGLTHN